MSVTVDSRTGCHQRPVNQKRAGLLSRLIVGTLRFLWVALFTLLS